VLDTVSRREWLNLHGAYTPGYAELTGPENDCNPTCTKGQFSGWTLASEQDVMELLNNAGLSPYGAENRDAAYGFIVAIGATYANWTAFPIYSVWLGSEAITRDKLDSSSVRGVRVWYTNFGGGETSQTVRSISSSGTAWLYRDGPSIPDARFCASPASGPAPLTVNFSDASILAESWRWDFGDGTTSTEKNPAHEYLAPGTYTVSLTVTGSDGPDTETKTDFVSIRPPTFEDAANSAYRVNAIAGNAPGVFWNAYLGGDAVALAEDASARAQEAYLYAIGALDGNSSFWGQYAVQYAEASMNVLAEVLTSVEQALAYEAAENYALSLYYKLYALSLMGTADLYNASTIWCSAMESSAQSSGQTGVFPGSPSFANAAYSAWLAHWCLDTVIAYSIYVSNDPAYYPLLSLYASASYQYAQKAFDEATAALAAAGDDHTIMGTRAVEAAAADLESRAAMVERFNLAEQAYRAGDLDLAEFHLGHAFREGESVIKYNGEVIWRASMESRGGTR
jgi:PKD repeat protein